MMVAWSHGHDVVKRSAMLGERSGPEARRTAAGSERLPPLLEILIAVAAGLAITWFLVTALPLG